MLSEERGNVHTRSEVEEESVQRVEDKKKRERKEEREETQSIEGKTSSRGCSR